MNKESYDSLSNDLKSLLRHACLASALEGPSEYFANSGYIIRRFKTRT